MSSPIKIYNYGSLLIESPVDENEEQFRANITELLVNIYGQLPTWLTFKVGRQFERMGIIYREFLCPAGSVDSNIQLRAQKPGGVTRSIILRGTRSDKPSCSEIHAGVETEFDCDELRQIENLQ
jgi:hypothetical protein